MTTAYFMAPVRGKDGESVSAEVKAANVKKGVEIGLAIRRNFPEIDVYIPHEHEEIIDILWHNGVSGDRIVAASCEIAVKRDIGLMYTGNGISKGMADEYDAMSLAGKPVVAFSAYDEATRKNISEMVHEK